ncbi:endonuclease/exonuclease/phosphatase family protein [Hoeflea prorocentri]|uniref:Endonuclease/exonuclease/phosphatase family protein n=1 Tax=Hoeflea prorocentri TaxID=1922333 RepID=A0A9X3UGD1_9HYPH|nr:endonuclease/exonuclease/phosphatase family protein [Hoeflea prorocentri]MCY6380350.1 endonuclease/exonuclease/phosphatase family protein [Hoeflea prorocentri]MDA5398150.1 endonuclease/exonuclease/phosphatase family protein [Hoeflea prorocentri]
MFYFNVRNSKNPERTAAGLLRLKVDMEEAGIPPRHPDTTLIATWNIREFDSKAYGERSLECLYYIAEICSKFDIIAVQEVRERLDALEQVRAIMGRGWKYIVSDVSEGKPGNRERMAFLYDSNKVRFTGLAGEIVIPPIQIKENGKTVRYDPARQLYRTPFIVGFKSGWTTLQLCTVHILYGEDEADNEERAREIASVAQFLSKRAQEGQIEDANLVLLGDFNIYKPTDITMKAITDAGFVIPEELQDVPATNTGKKKRHYDQIAVMPQMWRMETTGRAGVFDFYNTVYRALEEDEVSYAEEMGEAYNVTSKGKVRTKSGKTSYYRTYWRTHQMSDHLPMWMEIRSDFSVEYLEEFMVPDEL